VISWLVSLKTTQVHWLFTKCFRIGYFITIWIFLKTNSITRITYNTGTGYHSNFRRYFGNKLKIILVANHISGSFK